MFAVAVDARGFGFLVLFCPPGCLCFPKNSFVRRFISCKFNSLSFWRPVDVRVRHRGGEVFYNLRLVIRGLSLLLGLSFWADLQKCFLASFLFLWARGGCSWPAALPP